MRQRDPPAAPGRAPLPLRAPRYGGEPRYGAGPAAAPRVGVRGRPAGPFLPRGGARCGPYLGGGRPAMAVTGLRWRRHLRSAPPAAGQRERGPGAAAGAAAAPGSPVRPASLLPGPPPPRPPSRLPPGPGAFPKRCPRSRAGGPQGSPSGERDPAPAPGRLKCPEGCVCPRVCQPGCLRCEPGEFRRGRGLW